MSEFLDMGEYGTFIWAAYILFFVVQLVLALRSWHWQRQVARDVTQIKAMREDSGQNSSLESSGAEAE